MEAPLPTPLAHPTPPDDHRRECLAARAAGALAGVLAFLLPLVIAGCARLPRSAPAVPRAYAIPDRACPPEGIVDRIEGDLAVVVRDGGIVVTCPARGLREGEVLRDGRPDPVATRRLAADVARLRRRLGEGDDGKDLGL